ncbi:MAG: tetratricopeptide repeat protein [Planctomycetota bacterium]
MDRIAQLQKILQAEPGDPFALYALAQEHAKAGDHGEAVGWYARCIESDAHEHYAYFHMARSLGELGRGDEAVETLRRGLALAERDGNAKAAGEIAALLDEMA